MKNAIPSRVLEFQKTQGQYRQFFIDNDLNRSDISFLELTEHTKKIKDPLIRFGCVSSIIGESAVYSDDKEIQETGLEFFRYCQTVLESYITGEIELSDIDEITDTFVENITKKFDKIIS